MNASEAYILSSYKEIAVLNAEHGVTLVQDTTSGIVYVKKILTIYNAEVYLTLKNHPVPGIPEIIEMIEEDDRLIVIEEYIGGQTLRAILDNGNLFPEEEAVRIVEQVCVIVNDLHSADPPIIHRDIKPSNIICTPDGSIRLLDMNAARKVVTGKSEDTQLIGTVGYAAPEQFGFGASTVQTDIYAIGVLLCELMTGPGKDRPDHPQMYPSGPQRPIQKRAGSSGRPGRRPRVFYRCHILFPRPQLLRKKGKMEIYDPGIPHRQSGQYPDRNQRLRLFPQSRN